MLLRLLGKYWLHAFQGSEVLNASALAVGSVSWVDADYSHSGECFYCKQGFSSRCEKSVLFGCDHLDGAQADYVSDFVIGLQSTGHLMVTVPIRSASQMQTER